MTQGFPVNSLIFLSLPATLTVFLVVFLKRLHYVLKLGGSFELFTANRQERLAFPHEFLLYPFDMFQPFEHTHVYLVKRKILGESNEITQHSFQCIHPAPTNTILMCLLPTVSDESDYPLV